MSLQGQIPRHKRFWLPFTQILSYRNAFHYSKTDVNCSANFLPISMKFKKWEYLDLVRMGHYYSPGPNILRVPCLQWWSQRLQAWTYSLLQLLVLSVIILVKWYVRHVHIQGYYHVLVSNCSTSQAVISCELLAVTVRIMLKCQSCVRITQSKPINIDKRLCYCRGTARRATSVEILWPFFDWAIDKKLC